LVNEEEGLASVWETFSNLSLNEGGRKQCAFSTENYQMLTDFQNSFTVRIKRQFAIKLLLQIPPRLKCVATLPCEMSVS